MREFLGDLRALCGCFGPMLKPRLVSLRLGLHSVLNVASPAALHRLNMMRRVLFQAIIPRLHNAGADTEQASKFLIFIQKIVV